jgi:PBSX family phage terminase large subunit
MIYRAHAKQALFHKDTHRIRGVFSGRRGGKTECGAIESIIFSEGKIGFKDDGVDRYTGVIIAPTTDMLRRLSFEKFLSYSKPFKPMIHKSFNEIYWHNGAIVYGISGEHPARLEGIKANWIWMDEVFQLREQIFLEALARVSDTQGRIWVTGSLGTQYTNPKSHWVYKHFKQKPLADSAFFEWSTLENPYFPKDEITRLKETLDPKTFRQMFELSWDVQSSYQVYDDFDDANIIKGYQYDPSIETSVSIDWGFAHKMACLFFQYDKKTDRVYCFDEIVGSKITIEQLWDRIKSKGYQINNWYCDIAGTQEREQTGKSNVRWFSEAPRNIHFKYRSSAINYGIPIVRSYIKNGLGQRRFFVDEIKCPNLIDGLRNYAYPEKNGVIQNENPVKKDDDCVDGLRYFFVNRLDYNRTKDELANLDRWRIDSWR